MTSKLNKNNAILAKAVTAACFRNTYIEEIHSGILPISVKGDFSDVFITDSLGNNIPWNKAARITDEEMRILMKEIVNKMYTFFEKQYDEEYCSKVLDYAYLIAKNWDDPQTN